LLGIFYDSLIQNYKLNNFVAIVGQSGSGKSTLMKLIYRLYSPNEGNIFIDGFDISKVELTSLRNQIGIVPQESLLFNGTIRDNIDFKDKATEKEIIEASKLACAHDFIMELPNGYSTLVSEKGSTLSGGQRQRTALGRALLVNSPIVVLDDALASVDNKTAARIIDEMREKSNKTILMISHQLSVAANCDRVLVMDKGEIVQEGKHKDLVKNSGLYKQLWERELATKIVKS